MSRSSAAVEHCVSGPSPDRRRVPSIARTISPAATLALLRGRPGCRGARRGLAGPGPCAPDRSARPGAASYFVPGRRRRQGPAGRRRRRVVRRRRRRAGGVGAAIGAAVGRARAARREAQVRAVQLAEHQVARRWPARLRRRTRPPCRRTCGGWRPSCGCRAARRRTSRASSARPGRRRRGAVRPRSTS